MDMFLFVCFAFVIFVLAQMKSRQLTIKSTSALVQYGIYLAFTGDHTRNNCVGFQYISVFNNFLQSESVTVKLGNNSRAFPAKLAYSAKVCQTG